ncbi:MAG: hypothetical protein J6W08_03335 [Alphaproteobacteria bacterium]|nr:hypothetical protein [Alphaproteobacteria bacterium]
MKKILFFFCALLISTAHADVLDDCLNKIVKQDKIWQDILFNKSNGIFGFLGDNDEVKDEDVQNNKAKIYNLLAKDIEAICSDKVVQIAKISGRREIPFTHNNQEYAFDFDISRIFDYTDNIRTGILVINKRNLSPGNVLQLSSIPKKQKFFSDACSDWTIWDNLDDDGAVNVAGQAVFNEFGGSKNEFFLDFAEGDNRRAFPGLVLMDETGSTKEHIVTYLNPSVAMKKTQQFAEKLKGSTCSNQGLAVYLVALNVKKDTTSGAKDGWAIGLASGGAAGAATAGVALWVTAGAATTVPIAGWIVAGVLATAATVVTLVPATIEKINQVMILDGPYIL